jgi:hypothetical protein
MSLIKLATKELHDDLERLAFNQKMFRSEQTQAERADYLLNWYEIFSILDPHVPREIQRLPHVCYDLDRLRLPSSEASSMAHGYCAYLEAICDDLRPHIYINYLGLMYGGQIMARRYPHFPTEIYTFDDLDSSRQYIREQIVEETDDFIIETKHAFRWHIAIAAELGEKYDLD